MATRSLLDATRSLLDATRSLLDGYQKTSRRLYPSRDYISRCGIKTFIMAGIYLSKHGLFVVRVCQSSLISMALNILGWDNYTTLPENKIPDLAESYGCWQSINNYSCLTSYLVPLSGPRRQNCPSTKKPPRKKRVVQPF